MRDIEIINNSIKEMEAESYMEEFCNGLYNCMIGQRDILDKINDVIDKAKYIKSLSGLTMISCDNGVGCYSDGAYTYVIALTEQAQQELSRNIIYYKRAKDEGLCGVKPLVFISDLFIVSKLMETPSEETMKGLDNLLQKFSEKGVSILTQYDRDNYVYDGKNLFLAKYDCMCF